MFKFAFDLGKVLARNEKEAADLSKPENRQHVAKSDFAMPNSEPKGESHAEAKGKYPVPDKAHARAALGFCAMHHGSSSSECQTVEHKVHSKFPGMG